MKTPAEQAKEWRKNNPEKVKAYRKKYQKENKERLLERGYEYRDKNDYGGNRQKALERDNFKCTECGMTQEEHMILFNKGLTVDHIDGKGRYSKIKNNEMKNLKTLCLRCHGRKDGPRCMKDVWGDLLNQDNSEWKYPKLKKLVDSKVDEGFSVTQSKRIVASELGVSFWTIDGYYYERKYALGEQHE